MGCHSPSPTVPSSLFASFPFLTEKEARGSPRNGNYRRNLFCETPEKEEAGKAIPVRGRQMDVRRPRSMSSTISSAVVAHDGVNGEMVRQHDRRTAQGTTRQLHRQKGGKASLFTLTSRFSFHLQNGILKNLIEEVYREARDDRHLSHNCFQMLIFGPNRNLFIFQNHYIEKNTKNLGVCSFCMGDSMKQNLSFSNC